MCEKQMELEELREQLEKALKERDEYYKSYNAEVKMSMLYHKLWIDNKKHMMRVDKSCRGWQIAFIVAAAADVIMLVQYFL